MIFLIGVITFFVLIFLSVPIWTVLTIIGAYWTIFLMHLNASMFAPSFFTAVDKWILLAVPYYLVAGNIMAYCGPAESLVRFIDNLVGHLRGGLSIAAILGCAVFGAISGSATATAAAIGTIILPQMIAAGYDKRSSMGLLAASGTLGTMIPPSIYMIIFASIVQMDVAVFFLSGFVPGLMIAALLMVPAVFFTQKSIEKSKVKPLRQIWGSFLHSLPALFMPIIVLGGIYAGIFTPTEAAVVSCVYAVLISKFFYKGFSMENFKKSLVSGMTTTTIIFSILGGATLFACALTFTGIPQELTEIVISHQLSSTLLLINIGLLYMVLGCFLDPIPILYITMPLIWPIASALKIDPIHMNVVTIACMMLAMVTPPFGMNLFVTSGFMKENVEEVIIGAIPYLIVLIVAVFLVIFFPQISLILPNLLVKQ